MKSKEKQGKKERKEIEKVDKVKQGKGEKHLENEWKEEKL